MTKATPRAAPLARIIGILLLSALAMPGIGHAQVRDNGTPAGFTGSTDRSPAHGRDGGRLGGPIQRGGRDEDGPVKPVPEPGTMALVAMGVVALGGAIRKRRNA